MYKVGNFGAVAILFCINLVNYIDRYTVAAVISDLQNKTTSGFDSDISDTESGLLQTIFVVVYMIASPFFGHFGDRMNRKLLLGIGVVIWSLSTLAGSFAPNYAVLLVCRAFVGIGEASYATISPTLIADMYGEETRTAILSYYYVAIPLGSALGFIIGGQVSAALNDWRWAFRITPGLSFLLAFIQYALIEEPERGAADGLKGVVHEHKSFRGVLKDWKMLFTTRSFVWSTAGFTAVNFTVGALAWWAPTFIYKITLQSDDVWSKSKSSFVFGAITCVTGIFGTLMGAWLSRLFSLKRDDAYSYVCGIGMLVAAPFCILSIMLAEEQLYATWALIFVGEIFLCLNWAPVAAILLSVVPPHLRSSAEGFQTLVSHLLGDAISPLIVGGISDLIQSKQGYDSDSGQPLKFALLSGGVASLLGALFFFASGKTLAKDRKAVVDSLSAATGYAPLRTDREFEDRPSGEHASLLVGEHRVYNSYDSATTTINDGDDSETQRLLR